MILHSLYISFILLFIFFICFHAKQNTDHTIRHTVDQLDYMRGIFAIIIVIGHCAMEFQSTPFYFLPFTKLNTMCVGVFFVISGYGLAWSKDNKNQYLKKRFLKRKLLYLLKAAVGAFVFSLFFTFLQSTWFHIPHYILKPNWYLYVQTLFYILFYFIFKKCNNLKQGLLWITGITVGITTILFLFHMPRIYFISEWSFPFGIFLYTYKKEISYVWRHQKKFLIPLISCFTIISCISFIVPDYSILDFILHNTLNIAFVMILLMLFSYFKFENSIIQKLNYISFPLYLLQFPLLVFYKFLFQYYKWEIHIIYLILVLGTDILCCVTYKYLKEKIVKKRPIN